MHTDLKYFSTTDLANLIGVHVSTIKRWTDEGKLECIKTAGGHRKFTFQHVAHFLEERNGQSDRTSLIPIRSDEDLRISYEIMENNQEFLRDYILTRALQRRRKQVNKVLTGLYLAQYPLARIYDDILTPVLHNIGTQWETGGLSILEEHIASQTIRDAIIRLQGMLALPEETRGNVLCLSLTSELHDIAIKMVDHVLEEEGFAVIFAGQMTPLYGIEVVLEKYEIRRLYMSSTYVPDPNQAEFELNFLYDQCSSHGIEVLVGGRGFDKLNHDHPAVKARLHTFVELLTN